MILHHDLGWWAFVISIFALMAAYPLDLLAHLTSPLVKNWWAERSIRSLKARIDKLERQLAQCDNVREISDGEYHLLKASEGLALLIGLCTSLVALAVIIVVSKGEAGLSQSEHLSRDRTPIEILAVFGSLTAFLMSTYGFRRFARVREERSAIGRKAAKKNLEELKNKLLTRTGS
jgi:hypothetical protein